MFGHHGRLLRVDVESGRGEWRSLEESALRRCLGGSGLAAHVMLREDADADPLEPASPLVIAFSPLVGSPLTTSAKFAVVGKSPLTDRYNDSLVSSGFALAGKRTGADAIVIVGRAPRPSVLVIDQGEARLEPAGDLWGASCADTSDKLKERLGSDFQMAVIGPAGERLVRFATISHDGRHAGRGGNGAILGAKNIKAIAARGTRRVAWADPEGLVALAKQLSARSFGPATAKYRELGTAANLLVFNRLQCLPTRNFQQGEFAEAEQLSPEAMMVERDKVRASCAACTIGCEHLYSIESNGASIPVRLEYENLFALGSLCGIGSAEDVLQASLRCDEAGLDTISAGGVIAYAMECVERGLLDEPWLRFGDGQAMLKAIDLIARKEGLGARLAGGVKRLSESIGGEALEFAAHVKGLELPGYEPRGLQTMALGFAVGARGADHNRSGAYEADFSDRTDRRRLAPEDALLAIETEDKAAVMDSLILCKFLRGVLTDFYEEAADMLRLTTGWDIDAQELLTTAKRIVTAKKRFNIRCGWTPAEDTLPARFFTQTLPEEHQTTIDRQQFQAAVTAYNRGRGWSDEGWIPEA